MNYEFVNWNKLLLLVCIVTSRFCMVTNAWFILVFRLVAAKGELIKREGCVSLIVSNDEATFLYITCILYKEKTRFIFAQV